MFLAMEAPFTSAVQTVLQNAVILQATMLSAMAVLSISLLMNAVQRIVILPATPL